jgi:hypothetical protein
VQVLLTIVLIAGTAMWAMAIIRSLARKRDEVMLVWKKLEADQENEAIKSVYNRHVAAYNAALASFPAYLVAPLAGFKPARRF